MENRIVHTFVADIDDELHLFAITENRISHDLGIVNPNAMGYDYIGLTLGTAIDLLGVALTPQQVIVSKVQGE